MPTLPWHPPCKDFRLDCLLCHSPQGGLAKAFDRPLMFLAFFPRRHSLDLPQTQLLSSLLEHAPTLNWWSVNSLNVQECAALERRTVAPSTLRQLWNLSRIMAPSHPHRNKLWFYNAHYGMKKELSIAISSARPPAQRRAWDLRKNFQYNQKRSTLE